LNCLDILLKVVDDDANFILLIEWVKHLLDDRSRTVIAKCLGKYQTDVHNLNYAKQEKKEQPVVDQLEKKASCFAAPEVPPLPISLVCWLFHHP
jgi:hypothetical protein